MEAYRLRFPDWKQKAVTFSYDDGTECDRRLVDLFDRYHVKGTFHLNTGKFGKSNSYEEYVRSDEIEDLYEGHEVSAHGVRHAFFSDLTRSQILTELLEDRRTLERLCHYPVRGMSYPFGEFYDEVVDLARAAGMEYSRTVEDTMNFNLPADFMRWHPTCHHNKAFSMLDEFCNQSDWRDLALFYIWGHSFEFERENTWDMIEEFLRRLSTQDNIWFATNIEIKDYLCAGRAIVATADGDILYNPSAIPVFLEHKGNRFKIGPGDTLQF